MTVVSNQSIDDQEMGSFMEYTKAQRMPLMTRAHVEKVAAALKTAEKYDTTPHSCTMDCELTLWQLHNLRQSSLGT